MKRVRRNAHTLVFYSGPVGWVRRCKRKLTTQQRKRFHHVSVMATVSQSNRRNAHRPRGKVAPVGTTLKFLRTRANEDTKIHPVSGFQNRHNRNAQKMRSRCSFPLRFSVLRERIGSFQNGLESSERTFGVGLFLSARPQSWIVVDFVLQC